MARVPDFFDAGTNTTENISCPNTSARLFLPLSHKKMNTTAVARTTEARIAVEIRYGFDVDMLDDQEECRSGIPISSGEVPAIPTLPCRDAQSNQGISLSGWGDLNSRPLRPERSALTGLRYTPNLPWSSGEMD